MKTASPKNSQRAKTRLEIRLKLMEKGIEFQDIANATLLEVGTVKNVLSGCTVSLKARQRITDFVQIELWPGMAPRPHAVPDIAFLEAEIAKIEALQRAGADEAAVHSALLTLAGHERFDDAAEKLSTNGPIALMMRLTRLLAPILKGVSGENPRESGPHKIQISQREEAPV